MLGSSAPLLAYVSLLLWVGVVIGFAPSAWRYIRGPYNLIDSYRAGLFFVGLLWAMGLGRLVFFPQAEDARRAVIALSCALAAYLVVLARQGALR